MEKEEPDTRPVTGVSWRDNSDGVPVVDPEKEMLGEQERTEQEDSSETPDSGTTLGLPVDGMEEKSDSELPPAADNATQTRSARPDLQGRAPTYASSTRTLPRLKRKETRMMQKEAHPMQHLGITLGLPAILLFDIVVPCIIYYTWYNSHKHRWERECREQFNSTPQECPLPKPEYDENILGYAIISFGAGELWILIARVYRLFVHTEECAPLLSRSKWELDATSWVYGVAMILALIPFVVGSSLVLPHLYLYSPTFIMGFLGILMLITEILPINIPIGINSQARGTKLRPFIYYAAEDFIAVDGLQDREFRVRYNDRYENNKAFRNMFRYLTWWWLFGVCTYIGCVSAVIWTLEFHYAFGLSLGVLFSYIAIWAAVSYVWVKLEIEREHKAFEEGKFDP
ncbi:hypothetical protein AYL99_08179 [Fonsecaea erecta]|uniref:Uncharacterized protein n=1 Tax=Fonsecaea erecta TaxID=1367422 RepID=A0A178ZD93_9EURO|nr:hypothetical protein AYL99_08179 [Fonsecaea erecta]OAP57441.1 hypothetical protein AYL99_08179 [Fonsecaea erecta]